MILGLKAGCNTGALCVELRADCWAAHSRRRPAAPAMSLESRWSSRGICLGGICYTFNKANICCLGRTQKELVQQKLQGLLRTKDLQQWSSPGGEQNQEAFTNRSSRQIADYKLYQQGLLKAAYRPGSTFRASISDRGSWRLRVVSARHMIA